MSEPSKSSDAPRKRGNEAARSSGDVTRSADDSAWLEAREERVKLRTELELEQLEREQEIARLQRELAESRLRTRERLVVLEAEEELALRRARDRDAELREREMDLDRSTRSRRTTTRTTERPARRSGAGRASAAGSRFDRDIDDDDALEPLRELPQVLAEETTRVVRGLSNAYVEQASLMADVAESVADSLFSRPARRERKIVKEPRGRSVSDPVSSRALSDALYTAIEAPRRAVDDFYRAYSED